MTRGAILIHPSLELLLLVPRALTIVLSAHNALYFARYRSGQGKRRLGAVILVLINLAIGAESLAFGLLPWNVSRSTSLTLGTHLVAASLSLVVALAMAILILRQRRRRR